MKIQKVIGGWNEDTQKNVGTKWLLQELDIYIYSLGG